RAIDLDPTIGMAYAERGLVYRRYYGQQDEARIAYKRAVELSPSDAEILIEYARFLAYNEEYAEAILFGKRAIAIDPEDFAHHDRLGIVYLTAGDSPAAAGQFRLGININPAAGSGYMLLATAEAANGNTAGARDNLNRALQIWQPTPVWGKVSMAYLYGRLGDPDQAARLVAQLDDSIFDPLDPDRAFALLGTGDREGALREWTDLVNSYLEEGLPADPGPINEFKVNWSRDPVLDQPEFVEVRSRLGFRE
ncbi:MAG: tetratricopeptide repeat protein, partial [Gammaproteobacteria bacterium]|nr:tetratricopeptide repeat protein [Gammaproteobacteria bacterium]